MGIIIVMRGRKRTAVAVKRMRRTLITIGIALIEELFHQLICTGWKVLIGWSFGPRHPIVLTLRFDALMSPKNTVQILICVQQVWQNMPGELNDGPACRCSKKAREAGIRHGIYVGETPLPQLDMHTNNWSKLYHYRLLAFQDKPN